MSYNYTLKYRRFDQLLSDVKVDFQNFALEDLIDNQTMMKVARKCNYDLGMRIYKTKETLLDIEHFKVRLPDDFFVFNFGTLCSNHIHTEILPQGTHLEEVPAGTGNVLLPPYRTQPIGDISCTDGTVCPTCLQTQCACQTPSFDGLVYSPSMVGGDWCAKPRVFMNCKNEGWEVIQVASTRTTTYSTITPVKIKPNPESVECGCPNLYMKCADEIWIKDGFIHSNLRHGKLYVSYQGLLEDDEGNILVPDHDGLNDFYEYSLKERILENLYFNGEDVERKLLFVAEKRKVAKGYAKSIVNTPNFSELKELFRQNRKAQYAKYYAMFKGTPYFYGLPGYWNHS